jgi:hypothetical protein
MGSARNIAVVKTAQAVIAVGGNYATLSEIAFALQSGLPVIGLDTWQISRNGSHEENIFLARGPSEAVAKALELIGEKCQTK